MNILFLNIAEEWGGGEGWTLRTAAGLAAKEHSVVMVGREGAPLIEKSKSVGLVTHEIPVKYDYAPATIRKLLSLYRKYAVDVVVVHHNKDVRTGGVAAKLSHRAVVHRNGYPILHNNIRHRFSTSFVDRILTNSRRIQRIYEEFPWWNKPIDFVPNGVLPPSGVYERDKWNEVGLDPTQKIAYYAGRLTTVKQIHHLLTAFSLLPERSEWQLAIAGTGSEEEALKTLTAQLRLGNRIRFLGFRDDSPLFAGIADLVLLPSKEEGMPNTLLEAMIRGTAVAATPAGDVPFMLDNSKAGWIIKHSTPENWSRLLLRLESRPEQLEIMGKKGQQRAQKLFSHEKMIDDVEKSLLAAHLG